MSNYHITSNLLFEIISILLCGLHQKGEVILTFLPKSDINSEMTKKFYKFQFGEKITDLLNL